MAECRKCGYSGDDFYPSVKNKCRTCVRACNDAWRKDHPSYMTEKGRERRATGNKRFEHMWYRYGLHPDVYVGMVGERQGRCDICGQPFDPLHVDHCHETGVIRGLLCRSCNTGLGHFRDSPDRLESAARYIESAHCAATKLGAYE